MPPTMLRRSFRRQRPRSAWHPAEVAQFATELPQRIVEQLAIERLETSRAVANMLQLLGIIERVVEPGIPGDPTHPEFERKRLHLSNLVDLVRSPAAYFETLYEWGSPTSTASDSSRCSRMWSRVSVCPSSAACDGDGSVDATHRVLRAAA